jgi:hypothetical protein
MRIMRRIKQSLRWAQLKARRLRSLVKDEDHDTWYDHGPEHERPPNIMGPGMS